MKAWHLGLAVFFPAVVPVLALAQVTPFGVEFQVNTYTPFDQTRGRVCRAPDGASVVVWEGRGNQDGQDQGIFAQRYDSRGGASGSEFQVNSHTERGQNYPAVCCDVEGDFVVAWQSSGQDNGDNGIFAQRFSSSGVRQGTEFQVNTYTDDDQRVPAVCCAPDGRFVISWDSDQGGDEPDVFGQRFDSSGAPSGTEFQVNAYTPDRQTSPQLCCNGQGDFVIVWNDSDRDGDDYGVFGQRFGSLGAPLGEAFQVNSYTRNYQDSPSICCGRNGRFVVTWESDEVKQDGVGDGIFGQRFDDGGPVGSEFQVNTYTYYNQAEPSVCCDTLGNFAVVWQSEDQDGSKEGVFGQLFDPAATRVGTEFQVNTYSQDGQAFPDVGCDADGDLLVVWRSLSQDGSDFGVFAQLFASVKNTSGVPAASQLGLAALTAVLVGLGIKRLLGRR